MKSKIGTKITPAEDIPAEVSSADLSEILGVGVRQLQRLTREGWIEGKLTHGRYNLKTAVRTYLGYCLMVGRSR